MQFMKKFRKENKGLSFKEMGREGGKAYRKMRGGGNGDMTTTNGKDEGVSTEVVSE
jgi:hypothetical protein